MATTVNYPNGSITYDNFGNKAYARQWTNDGLTTMIFNGDGSTTTITGTGTNKVVKNSNAKPPTVISRHGEIETIYSDGSSKTQYKDGRVELVSADGVKEIYDKDGKLISQERQQIAGNGKSTTFDSESYLGS